MLGNKLCHFEHIDYCLTAKDLFKIFVGINVALVSLILKIILLNVDPEFFNNL